MPTFLADDVANFHVDQFRQWADSINAVRKNVGDTIGSGVQAVGQAISEATGQPSPIAAPEATPQQPQIVIQSAPAPTAPVTAPLVPPQSMAAPEPPSEPSWLQQVRALPQDLHPLAAGLVSLLQQHGASSQEIDSGLAVQHFRDWVGGLADQVGGALPDITGTLQSQASSGPLEQIATGQPLTATEQLRAAPDILGGYEAAREQSTAALNPARDVPVVGGVINSVTDPLSGGPIGVGQTAESLARLGAKVAPGVLGGALEQLDKVSPPEIAHAAEITPLRGFDLSGYTPDVQQALADFVGTVDDPAVARETVANFVKDNPPGTLFSNVPAASDAASAPAMDAAQLLATGTPSDMLEAAARVAKDAKPATVTQPTLPGFDDVAQNIADAAETAAKKPVSLGELANAYHSGNLVMGTATAAHVALSSAITPAWSWATRSAADLLTLNPSRAVGRQLGAGTALVNVGQDLIDGWRTAMAEPGAVANRVEDPLVRGFLQFQRGVGGALHGAFQTAAGNFVERMELGALAGEQARREGLTGVDWVSRVSQLIADPSAGLSDAAMARAQDIGQRGALRGEAGTTQAVFGNLVKAGGPVGNALLPVYRIGAQSAARMIEASPAGLLGTGFDIARAAAGAGPYAKGFSQTGGAVTPLADRLINNLAGTALAAWLASKAVDGSITGSGPKDSRQRAMLTAQGWQPNSVRLPNGSYFDYTKLGQLAPAFMLAGAYGDAVRNGDAKTAADVAGEMVRNAAGSFIEGVPGVTTLTDIASVLQGGREANFAASQLLGNVASGYVPASGLVRSAALAFDPSARTVDYSNAITGALQVAQQNLPGLREQLPERLDVLGRVVPNKAAGIGGALFPHVSQEQPSPVLADLARYGVTVGGAPKALAFANNRQQITLTNVEKQRLPRAARRHPG